MDGTKDEPFSLHIQAFCRVFHGKLARMFTTNEKTR